MSPQFNQPLKSKLLTGRVSFISLLLLIGLLCSCVNQKSTDTEKDGQQELRGSIKIDGSTITYPLTEKISKLYQAKHSHVNIEIGLSGTGGGFTKFLRNEIDLNNASRRINDKEKQYCEENNIAFIELKVAYDKIAVVTNIENDWAKDITIAELQRLWQSSSQFSIKNWNDIRATWPNNEILLYAPGISSGTYEYFMNTTIQLEGSSRGDFTSSDDDKVLIKGISNNKHSIGFMSYSDFLTHQDMVKLLPVMEVTDESVLTRPLYLYVNTEKLQNHALVSFLSFFLDTLPSFGNNFGLIPLSDQEYSKQQNQLNAILAK